MLHDSYNMSQHSLYAAKAKCTCSTVTEYSRESFRNYHLKANHDSVVIMDDECEYLFTGNVKK